MLKRYFILLVLIPFLLISALVVTTRYINFNNYKTEIENLFKEHYSLITTIKGDISLEFTPYPYLLLSDVNFDYGGETLLRVNELKAAIPIFSLFIHKDLINGVNSVIIEGGNIYIKRLYDYLQYHNWQSANQNLSLKYFKITNVEVLDYTSNYSYVTNNIALSDLDITLQNKSINFKGNITYKNSLDNNVDITLSKDNSITSVDLSIRGEGIHFKTSGSMDQNSQGRTGKGTFILELMSLSKLTQYFDNPAKKDSTEATPSTNKPQVLDLRGDIVLDTNSLLKIFNITSKSSALSGISSNIIIDLSTANTYQVNTLFTAKSINFDNFLDFSSIDNDLRKEAIFSFVSSLYSSFDANIPSSIIGDFQVNIDNVKVFGENVEKISGEWSISQGRIILNLLEAKLPGESKLTVNGITTNNGIRSDFKGNFQLKVGDFPKFGSWLGIIKGLDEAMGIRTIQFDTNLSMIPRRIKFRDISLLINQSLVTGKMSFTKDGYGKVSAYIMTKIADIDLDSMNLDQTLDNLFYLLYRADFDKSGDTYYKLVNNYNWLRSLYSAWRFDCFIDHLIIKDEDYNNVRLIVDIDNNKLNISKFHFNTSAIEASGDFKFSLPAFRASIDTNININKLDLTNTQTIYTNYINDMREKLLKVTSKSSNIVTMIDNINFFSANNYDANISLNINNLAISNDHSLSNITSKIKLLGGIISMQGGCDGLNGKMTLNGNGVITGLVPQFNGTFVLDNINPNRLIYYITGLDKINGYMSVSGAISTYGTNKYNMLKQMDGQALFAGKRIYWDGIGLDNIINAVDSNYQPEDKVKQIEYYAQNGRSIFDDMAGNVRLLNGMATFPNITLSNNRLSSIFAANYDLPSRSVSSNGIISFIPMGYSGTLSIQVKTMGQFPNASSEIDTKQIINFIAPNIQKNDSSSSSTQALPNSDLRNRI